MRELSGAEGGAHIRANTGWAKCLHGSACAIIVQLLWLPSLLLANRLAWLENQAINISRHKRLNP